MRTSFIAAATLAAVVAARAPVAHKSVTPILKQADCDPTWQECEEVAEYGEEEYNMECAEDDEECLAMMMEEEEEEEAAASILMFAAPAALLSGVAGFLMFDSGSHYSDAKDEVCGDDDPCTLDEGLLGDLAGYKLLGMVNLAYTPIALAGAFVPAVATPVSFVSMAMVLQGVFTFISLGSYQDCTAAVAAADGYCNPATTADETTYA